MCFSHWAWPLRFSGASVIPTEGLLISTGDSWKGEESRKDDERGLEGVSTENLEDILPIAEASLITQINDVRKHNNPDNTSEDNSSPDRGEEGWTSDKIIETSVLTQRYAYS